MLVEHIEITSEQCRKLEGLGVCAVYLFGSQVERKDGPFSDIDIGILLSPGKSAGKDFSFLYNTMYDLFTDLFPERSVDIVFLEEAGLEITMDAIVHGQVIFESSHAQRLEVEQRVMMLYADFRPLLNLFDRAILQRM